MHPGRNNAILISIVFLFSCLAARVYYLQICQGQSLSRLASSQRMLNSQIEKPRGEILDRNLIPFTDREKRIFIVIKPLLLRDRDEDVKRVCDVLGLDFVKTKSEIDSKSEPLLFQTDEEKKRIIMEKGLQGISVVYSLKRYSENSIARHVTGYLNGIDRTGEAGIEKAYEDVLEFRQNDRVGVVTDARSNIIQGLGYRLNAAGSRGRGLNVKLTLDYHIQKIVEDVMDRAGISGAVVVEDVYTGDIAAMASRPNFEQDSVERYLNSSNDELFNKAVASYNLGSIFKIVDAAVFLTYADLTDETYDCSGSIRVGGKEFKCSSYDRGGHGFLDLKSAFAVSCNPFFINAGIKVGWRNLVNMAQKLGLGDFSGIRAQGVDESSGRLPGAKEYYTPGDTANIAIGQGEILATPMQVADMVATVANGGIKNKVNIVDSIVDPDGNKVRNIRVKAGERVIPREIGDRLKELMEEVTLNGTGTKAGLYGYGGSGGKTGSAETGRYVNDKPVVHAWFAGYFPKHSPRYSIAVFVEDGKSGGQVAAPIFEEIAEEIMKKGY